MGTFDGFHVGITSRITNDNCVIKRALPYRRRLMGVSAVAPVALVVGGDDMQREMVATLLEESESGHMQRNNRCLHRLRG